MKLLSTFLALTIICELLANSIPYTKKIEISNPKLGNRKRVAPKILAYPEMQYKYGLFQNFLDGYIDKPLFFNRAFRPKGKSFKFSTPDSYFKDLEIIRSYGFNGAGSLASGFFDRYKMVLNFLDKSPQRAPKNYMEFPQLYFGEAASRKLNGSAAEKSIQLALKSPFTPQINGRIPISTYGADAIPRDKMISFMKQLKEKYGDKLAICGNVRIDWRDNIYLHQHGKWSKELIEKYRKRIQDRLKVFDGIQTEISFERHGAEFQTTPDFTAFDKYIKPMILEELQKKENSSKLLCASVLQGYANHLSCEVRGEYGTYRLRQMLERVMALNCDFWFAFEWNEFNENSSWQPTVTNTLALQRLTKYYIDLMNDKTPMGNKSDDKKVPQMVLSYRQTLKIGEALRLELLNIPDSTPGEYQATLTLLDYNNKVIKAFPKEKFDRKTLQAITYTIDSSLLGKYPIIKTQLKLETKEGNTYTYSDSLQHIRLHPTYCRNYKEVRQSIRDIAQLKANFAVKKDKDNYALTCSITSQDTLASVEVLDNGKEVYAVDKANEFDLDNNIVIMGAFTTTKVGTRKVEISAENVSKFTFKEWGFPSTSIGSDWQQTGHKVTGNFVIWSGCVRLIMTVPKKDIAKGILTVKTEGEEFKLKIADLIKNRFASYVFPKCRIDIENLLALADYPIQINEKSVSFNTTLKSYHTYPVYQLRIVTTNGKIYYSSPIVPNKIPSTLEKMVVFSELKAKSIATSVCSALVPKINYIFSPKHGAGISNNYSYIFDGTLGGGYTYGNGYSSGGAGARNNIPQGRHQATWEKDLDQYILNFDGKSYLHLPSNSFPRGAFTLKFTVKPQPTEDTAMYMLCRHYAGPVGSMTLYSRYDKLSFVYFGRRDFKAHTYDTNLELKSNQWNNVEVSYDFNKVKFTVNGKSETFNMPNNPARSCKPFIFGGHTRPGLGLPEDVKYFKGLLKSLTIEHNSKTN